MKSVWWKRRWWECGCFVFVKRKYGITAQAGGKVAVLYQGLYRA